MAYYVQNKISPDWFTPSDEKEKASPARYKVRPLDGMEFLEVVPHVTIVDGFIHYDGKGMQILIRRGLLDWEGHTDPDTGNVLEFSADAVSRIPPLRLKAIAYEIANRSQLTEGEAKN